MCPPAWPSTPSGFRARNHPHAHQEKSEFGLADRTWLEAMYRKYGSGSLWVGSHIDARIPDVDAEQLIDPTWLDHHSKQQRQSVPPTHPVNFTRRIACDLAEGVGRDSTCVMVVDDWGVLEVVLGNGMGLPEAAEAISRLVQEVERTARADHVRQAGDRPQLPQPSGAVGESRRRSPTPVRAGRKTRAPTSTCAPRPAGSCAIGWIRHTRSYGPPTPGSSVGPRAAHPERCHSGRSTFALARTMPGWSTSCGH